VTFRISIVQQPLVWHDAAANHAHFGAVLRPLAGQTDLIVLPEMFTTGFTMNPKKHAEAADGQTRSWLLGQARALDAAVGDSAVLDFLGQPVVELTDKAQVVTAPIDLDALRDWRDKVPAHLDADAFFLE
jgi:predicted amidohydrolase